MMKLQNFWVLNLVSGICLLIFGTVTVINNDMVLSFIIMLVGIGFMFSGIKELLNAISFRKQKGWWTFSVYSLFSLVLGALFVLNPSANADVIVYFLAFFLLGRGISQLTFGFKFPVFKNLTIGSGIMMIVFSFIMFIYPVKFSELIITVIGLLIGTVGIFQIVKSYAGKQVVDKLKLQETIIDMKE